MKILICLSYVGTRYAGFQVQPGKPTIQSALQDALGVVYGERLPIKGCSRTDSGVHALCFYATYETNHNIPVERIPFALNSALPDDIAVKSAVVVPDPFHVRYDVKCKEYEYLLHNSNIRDPFLNDKAYRLSQTFGEEELSRMREAAKAFVGEHDFAGFMSTGSSVTDTRRNVNYVEILTDGELIRVRICANGFLYNMVRIIVGTLIECGRGRIDPNDLPRIIDSCDRSKAGATVPACGLYLRRVEFFEEALYCRK
jgi:tRNA pseudouridine38-40 synthase